MKRVIYKYKTGMNNNDFGAFHLELPVNSEIRSVEMQNKELCIWAQHLVSRSKRKRYFRKIATEEELPDLPLVYLGTVHAPPFVSHIFELLSDV